MLTRYMNSEANHEMLKKMTMETLACEGGGKREYHKKSHRSSSEDSEEERDRERKNNRSSNEDNNDMSKKLATVNLACEGGGKGVHHKKGHRSSSEDSGDYPEETVTSAASKNDRIRKREDNLGMRRISCHNENTSQKKKKSTDVINWRDSEDDEKAEKDRSQTMKTTSKSSQSELISKLQRNREQLDSLLKMTSLNTKTSTKSTPKREALDKLRQSCDKVESLIQSKSNLASPLRVSSQNTFFSDATKKLQYETFHMKSALEDDDLRNFFKSATALAWVPECPVDPDDTGMANASLNYLKMHHATFFGYMSKAVKHEAKAILEHPRGRILIFLVPAKSVFDEKKTRDEYESMVASRIAVMFIDGHKHGHGHPTHGYDMVKTLQPGVSVKLKLRFGTRILVINDTELAICQVRYQDAGIYETIGEVLPSRDTDETMSSSTDSTLSAFRPLACYHDDPSVSCDLWQHILKYHEGFADALSPLMKPIDELLEREDIYVKFLIPSEAMIAEFVEFVTKNAQFTPLTVALIFAYHIVLCPRKEHEEGEMEMEEYTLHRYMTLLPNAAIDIRSALSHTLLIVNGAWQATCDIRGNNGAIFGITGILFESLVMMSKLREKEGELEAETREAISKKLMEAAEIDLLKGQADDITLPEEVETMEMAESLIVSGVALSSRTSVEPFKSVHLATGLGEPLYANAVKSMKTTDYKASTHLGSYIDHGATTALECRGKTMDYEDDDDNDEGRSTWDLDERATGAEFFLKNYAMNNTFHKYQDLKLDSSEFPLEANAWSLHVISETALRFGERKTLTEYAIKSVNPVLKSDLMNHFSIFSFPRGKGEYSSMIVQLPNDHASSNGVDLFASSDESVLFRFVANRLTSVCIDHGRAASLEKFSFDRMESEISLNDALTLSLSFSKSSFSSLDSKDLDFTQFLAQSLPLAQSRVKKEGNRLRRSMTGATLALTVAKKSTNMKDYDEIGEAESETINFIFVERSLKKRAKTLIKKRGTTRVATERHVYAKSRNPRERITKLRLVDKKHTIDLDKLLSKNGRDHNVLAITLMNPVTHKESTFRFKTTLTRDSIQKNHNFQAGIQNLEFFFLTKGTKIDSIRMVYKVSEAEAEKAQTKGDDGGSTVESDSDDGGGDVAEGDKSFVGSSINTSGNKKSSLSSGETQSFESKFSKFLFEETLIASNRAPKEERDTMIVSRISHYTLPTRTKIKNPKRLNNFLSAIRNELSEEPLMIKLRSRERKFNSYLLRETTISWKPSESECSNFQSLMCNFIEETPRDLSETALSVKNQYAYLPQTSSSSELYNACTTVDKFKQLHNVHFESTVNLAEFLYACDYVVERMQSHLSMDNKY